jgi:hypothetical protein
MFLYAQEREYVNAVVKSGSAPKEAWWAILLITLLSMSDLSINRLFVKVRRTVKYALQLSPSRLREVWRCCCQ